MKSFIKKCGLPTFATVLVLAAVILIGLSLSNKAMKNHYYGKWVIDEAELFSAETKQQLAQTNRELDEKYGSIMGVVTVKNGEEGGISERAFAMLQSYGFGTCDLMLLICPETEKYYLADGDVISQYFPNDLRITLQQYACPELFDAGKADAPVLAMFDAAVQWYGENVPEHLQQRTDRHQPARGGEVLVSLMLLLVLAFVLLCLARYLFWPLFFLKASVKWQPLWGWHILGPLKRRKKGV